MNSQTHNMLHHLDAVDPMVLTLRSEVEELLLDDTRFRFEICITEVLANLVTHVKKKVSDSPIEIKMNLRPSHVSIEIFDPIGVEPFDPCSNGKSLSEVDAMAEGGRGIGLIMECADEVKYGQSGARNSLCLEFWDQTQVKDNPQSTNGARE